eukprot:m.95169 g.95169  ORF g.95169 m.95169 type:complete len:524 (-) comp10091_c0_seq2:194-1765(-)
MGIASTLHDRMSTYRACDVSSQRAPSASGINITIGLCHAAVFLSLCDRVQMSFAILSIADELGWTLDEQAQVLSAFFWGYIFTQFLGARFSARYGGQRVLLAALCGWSTLTIATPSLCHTSVWAACAGRAGLGLFEGTTFPCIFAILSPMVPRAQRGTVLAQLNMAATIGTVVACAVCPWLTHLAGWPSMFYLFGGAGFVVCAVWVQTGVEDRHNLNPHPTPQQRPSVVAASVSGAGTTTGMNKAHGESPGETTREGTVHTKTAGHPNPHHHPNSHHLHLDTTARAVTVTAADDGHRGASDVHAHTQAVATDTTRTVLRYLEQPAVVAICFSHACNNFGDAMVFAWLPTLMATKFGARGTHLSLSSLPHVARMVGAAVGGGYSDWLLRSSGLSATSVRARVVTCGFATAAVALVLLGWVSTTVTALALFSVERFSTGAGSVGGYEAAKLDIAVGADAALLQALANSVAAVASLLGTTAISVVVGMGGGWDDALLCAAVLYVASVVSYRTWGDSSVAIHGGRGL